MANFQNQQESFRVIPFNLPFRILGCWANPDGANPDDRGNPDDFLGKNLKLFLTLFLFVLQFYSP